MALIVALFGCTLAAVRAWDVFRAIAEGASE